MRTLTLFAKARHWWITLAVVIGLAGLTAWLGTFQATLPSASSQSGSVVPVWRLLAMGVGTLPVLSLHSPLDTLEMTGGERLRSTQTTYLIISAIASSAIYLTIISSAIGSSTTMVIGRSLPGWIGLALLSGRVLGWRLAWVAPAAAACVLIYWGGRGPDIYVWWEFSARPYVDLAALNVSLALLLVGAVAYWITPWRLSILPMRSVLKLLSLGKR